ncbi:MAG: type II secretion system F family protein [Actinomycetia bacterium]|nr:type II secretion system F family protein [Actinomycetes bacterium]
MTPVPIAALLLAAAVLIAPPARHRLGSPAPGRPRPIGKMATPVLLLAAAAIVVAAPPALGVACAIAVAVAAMRRRRWACQRRRHGEARAMAAALDVLVGELRVGAHPLRAFAVAASESTEAVGRSLRAVAARAHLGADVPAGMRAIAADSSVPVHWERLAVFWQLAAERGLPMSTLMRAAHRDITARQRFLERLQAGLAGARATAAILALLPALGVLLGQVVGAHPLRFLLGTGPGGWLLVLGVGLVCAGLVWADRIIDGVAA